MASPELSGGKRGTAVEDELLQSFFIPILHVLVRTLVYSYLLFRSSLQCE